MNNLLGLIGADFKRMAGLSTFGRVYRISRLNRLKNKHATELLGMDKRLSKAMREGWRLPLGEEGYVMDDIPDETWVGLWPSEADLVPYRLSKQRLVTLSHNHQLRGCLTCLRSGYHSLVHQVRWISLCPWHREMLTTKCPCGQRLSRSLVDADSFLGICVCGRDHYDRLSGLRSLYDWPEETVKLAIRNQVRWARRRQLTFELDIQAELDVDVAVARDLGYRTEHGYVLSSTFGPDAGSEDIEALRSVIRWWNNIDKADFYRYLYILPSDTKRLEAFAAALAELLKSKTNHQEKWPFISRNGMLFDTDAVGTPIGEIDSFCSWNLSEETLTFGHQLIRIFVDKQSPSKTRLLGYEDWDVRLEQALSTVTHDLKLLARTLSAIAAHAFMECWNDQAWLAYTDAHFRGAISQGKVTVFRDQTSQKTRVQTILPLPILKNPSEDEIAHFWRTIGRKAHSYEREEQLLYSGW